jgi:hypothetical protein
MMLTLQKVTGPEPAAGAVHKPAALVFSTPPLCVSPAHDACVREPVLAAKLPAIGSNIELKDVPKKAPSWKPRNQYVGPPARRMATRYWTPGEYAVTAAPLEICVSAMEKPPPAPATLP